LENKDKLGYRRGGVFLAIWMSEISKISKTNFCFLYFELSFPL
jgi:hypothetical protein